MEESGGRGVEDYDLAKNRASASSFSSYLDLSDMPAWKVYYHTAYKHMTAKMRLRLAEADLAVMKRT